MNVGHVSDYEFVLRAAGMLALSTSTLSHDACARRDSHTDTAHVLR
jgi:hypothetical protein